MTDKKTQRFTRDADIDSLSVTWTDKDTGQQLTLFWADVADDLKLDVSLYGLAKFVEDRESGVDPDHKLVARKACFNGTLKIGKWKKDAKKGARDLPIAIQVLMSLENCSAKVARASLADLDAETRKLVLGSKKFKDEEARILARSAKVEAEGLDLSAYQ